ncbi:MAG TPA: hypothetical protein PLQ76_08695, partial [bacterium]|nr:hypothetical protein [bacterium]
GICTLDDGTQVNLLGPLGWGGDIVTDRPVPMRTRPPSNYYWRSNPFTVNGDAGDRMVSSADFRIAYWLGRWSRIPSE